MATKKIFWYNHKPTSNDRTAVRDAIAFRPYTGNNYCDVTKKGISYRVWPKLNGGFNVMITERNPFGPDLITKCYVKVK